MRADTAALVLLTLIFLPAASQVPAAATGSADIPVEEWRAMSAGRTLTYRINGTFWALEHYFPGTNRVQLQLYDGSCMDGTWDYDAPHYCFHWNGQGTSCFRHARQDGTILIIESIDGIDTPMTQQMTDVSDTPLTCTPATS